ncbi:hypothetical protein BSK62_22005 [Paenibacillus odorifer]|nr:hypothetical protein BSK62_22005 [Paenibacillus odorifer]
MFHIDINYFEHQDTIGKNLLTFIRQRGYSKKSLSELTGISRPIIDELLGSKNTIPIIYNTQISIITQFFKLPHDYFLKIPTEPINIASQAYGSERDKRSKEIQELFDGLENILDIYSIYF